MTTTKIQQAEWKRLDKLMRESRRKKGLIERFIYLLYLLYSMVTDKTTTIKLHKSTVEDLKKRGEMGESYEDVILKLLKKVRSKNQE